MAVAEAVDLGELISQINMRAGYIEEGMESGDWKTIINQLRGIVPFLKEAMEIGGETKQFAQSTMERIALILKAIEVEGTITTIDDFEPQFKYFLKDKNRTVACLQALEKQQKKQGEKRAAA